MTKIIMCRKIIFLVFFLFLLAAGAVPADAAEAVIDRSQDSWGLLGGYGQSFSGLGRTTERVATVDLVPRYNRRLLADIGTDWYRGFHSIMVELPVHLVVSPEVSTMLGVNFLASYTFTAGQDMRPYLFGGGGPVYSFADVPGMGADLNGNYQFGLGLEYDTCCHTYLTELRFHHISNAGSEDPNIPLNSFKLLVGISF